MDIGNRIKEERLKRNLSQKELAYRSGFTITSISRWENGERDPKFKDVEKLSETLSIPLENFVSTSHSSNRLLIDIECEELSLLGNVLKDISNLLMISSNKEAIK